MGEGEGGEGEGSSLPFSLPSSPFSPETPDTQAIRLVCVLVSQGVRAP